MSRSKRVRNDRLHTECRVSTTGDFRETTLNTQTFQADHLHVISRRILMAAGTPMHIADNVAEILINSNLAGHDSHGLLVLSERVDQITSGTVDATAEPVVVKETGATLTLDGNRGFGLHAARTAMDRAIEKTKTSDVCCVGFRNMNHIGRIGEYAEAAARAGCVALITFGAVGDNYSTIPFGGADGLLRTNPVTCAFPTGDDAPFLLDMATSVVASGKIKVARSQGVDAPSGTIVDKDGVPTVKTEDFYDGGHLLTFGGHKGYGLSLMSALYGGLVGNIEEDGSVVGEFMQVIRVEAFSPLEEYQAGVRKLLDKLKSSKPAPGFDEVMVPGDFEARTRRARLADGIELPNTVVSLIEERAEKFGVSMDVDEIPSDDTARYQRAE